MPPDKKGVQERQKTATTYTPWIIYYTKRTLIAML